MWLAVTHMGAFPLKISGSDELMGTAEHKNEILCPPLQEPSLAQLLPAVTLFFAQKFLEIPGKSTL